MADDSADPVWDDESGAMVPLSTLPISDALKQRLTAWRERWEELNDAAMFQEQEPPGDPGHGREEHDLWMALREELGSEFEVGVAVPSPGRDTRVHVVWEPGGQPELPTWHRRSD